MYKTFFTVALLAIAGATGCRSHPKQCQHCANGAVGTAHIICDPKTGICAPSPCAPIPQPQQLAAQQPVVERPKPVPAPIRVAELPRPVAPRSAETYGCNEEYTWIVGKLRRVHVPGGDWKIRFLELDKIDKWGGSMVLAPDIRLEDFSDGDFVCIEGEILVKRPSLYLAGPLYRINRIRTVTLADRRRLDRTRLATRVDR